MKFELGHPILDQLLKNLEENFDPYDWGANGPKLVTR